MPRVVSPGIPFHVTQRGNRRGSVFFSDYDREWYLSTLAIYCRRHSIAVLAYCLMTNHVHLVLVPGTVNSLHEALRPLHMRHAQRINRLQSWSGHVWQGRYFASALDERYMWAAIRYVELNPVSAGLSRRAEDYRWSSAAAHCQLRNDPVLTTAPQWTELLSQVRDWRAWLEQGEDPEEQFVLQRNTVKGLPCGSEEFIGALESITGHSLQHRSRGRPRKSTAESGQTRSQVKKGCVPF